MMQFLCRHSQCRRNSELRWHFRDVPNEGEEAGPLYPHLDQPLEYGMPLGTACDLGQSS